MNRKQVSLFAVIFFILVILIVVSLSSHPYYALKFAFVNSNYYPHEVISIQNINHNNVIIFFYDSNYSIYATVMKKGLFYKQNITLHEPLPILSNVVDYTFGMKCSPIYSSFLCYGIVNDPAVCSISISLHLDMDIIEEDAIIVDSSDIRLFYFFYETESDMNTTYSLTVHTNIKNE